jgi:hypothetical protein
MANAHETKFRRWTTFTPPQCPALAAHCGLFLLRRSYGLSLYGMGRFPVTLYKEQWLRILANAPAIEAFIRDNDSTLKAGLGL